MLAVSDAPGLGVTLNSDALTAYGTNPAFAQAA